MIFSLSPRAVGPFIEPACRVAIQVGDDKARVHAIRAVQRSALDRHGRSCARPGSSCRRRRRTRCSDAACLRCLNLAQLQSGLSGTRIADNWRNTGPFDLSSLQPVWRYIAPWRLPSLLTFDRLLRQLPVWGVDFERVRRNEPAGTYNVYNFTDKAFETHPGGDLTPELFTACFALPIWFPAVELDGKTYIDGVYWKDANLSEAIARGADEIWVIWTVSETATYRPGPYAGYFNIIEAIADGRFYEELRQIEAINGAVRAGTDTEHREIRVHVIRHPTPVPLDYLLFFSPGDMSRIVDMGVRDARAYLAALNRLLATGSSR